MYLKMLVTKQSNEQYQDGNVAGKTTQRLPEYQGRIHLAIAAQPPTRSSFKQSGFIVTI